MEGEKKEVVAVKSPLSSSSLRVVSLIPLTNSDDENIVVSNLDYSNHQQEEGQLPPSASSSLGVGNTQVIGEKDAASTRTSSTTLITVELPRTALRLSREPPSAELLKTAEEVYLLSQRFPKMDAIHLEV